MSNSLTGFNIPEMRIFYQPAEGAAVFITEPKFGLKREQEEGNGISLAIDRMQTNKISDVNHTAFVIMLIPSSRT